MVATAIELRAHRLLTTDAGWPPLDVPVQVVGSELRTVPADQSGAAIGSLGGPGPTTDEMRAALRPDDASDGA